MTRTTGWLALLLAGCVGAATDPAPGPVGQSLSSAARLAGVPRDLLVAIAVVEGGVWLPAHRVVHGDDEVPVAGALELRHGGFDSLRRGAELGGVSEETLRADTALGTEVGARLFAELGRATGAQAEDLASWRAALAQLSGFASDGARDRYASQVLELVRAGGTFPARDQERLRVVPHPELAPAPLGRLDQAANGTPDFPGAIWFPTNCTNKCTPGRPDGNAAVDTIVIHDTEGGWSASVATLQNDPAKSVHYIVDADGSRVGQFINEADTAWHAGNWPYNMHSIGIEHVGMAADPNGYAPALYDKSVALVRNILSRWSVPVNRTHIIGHYQIPNGNLIPDTSPPCTDTLRNCETSANYGGLGNHRDPGFYWQWCQYFEKLGGTCTCNDAYPFWTCTTDHTESVRCTGGMVEIDHCSAGCVSMPINTDDVCNHAALDGGPTADGASDGGGSTLVDGAGLVDAALVDASSLADLATPALDGSGPGSAEDLGVGWGNAHGGCSLALTPRPAPGVTLLFGLALAAAIRPARRRAARSCAGSRARRHADPR